MVAAEETAWLPFLVVVALGGLVVFWLAVIAEVSSTPDADFRSGTKTTWLLITILFGAFGALVYLMAGRPARSLGRASESAHEVRQDPRTNLYWCIEPQCGFESQFVSAARNHRDSTARIAQTVAGFPRHVVQRDTRDAMYWCTACNFWTYDLKSARSHGGYSAGLTLADRPTPVSENTFGFGRAQPAGANATASQSGPSEPALTQVEHPEHKLCPDCAEQVRAAARKCRFCGYMFETSDASV
jgi:hypothetical protein